MTTPHNPEAPEVILADSIPASAGSPAAVPVQVRHRGRRPARIRVTIFGLDSRWVPQPLDLGVLQPGDTAAIKLSIVPERGAMGARYPFTIAAEASSVDGRSRPVVGVAESVLALDAAERISMAIVPSTPEGAFSKGFRVEITNPGEKERTFTLVPDSAAGVTARLSTHTVTVPPERTVAVKGRVHVKKPTIFGGHNTHTFTVAAQGTGAPEWAEGTMRSKPLVGKGVTAVFGLIMVVALWATLAIVFIPKISNAFKPKNEASVSTVQGDGSGDGAAGAGDGSGSGDGSSDGSSDGSGDGSTGGSAGGDGSGDGGSGTANGGHPAGGYQLSGTVTGSGADGATVILAPVSLASAGDDGSLPAAQSVGSNPNALRGQGAAFAPAAAPAADPIGKIPGPLAGIAPGGFRTTTILTTDKGEFTFSGVTAPGFYLLTLAKAGYQTQRFLINSATLASPQPLKVELQPGKGKLSGMVTGPGGSPLGAATIVVTDGTVTLQTSSVSASTHSGTPGSWTLDQVSTPGTYLVTASSPGLGAASTLVSLDASGSATVNLSLQAGQTSITGKVSGADSLGNVGGLGGITVTATDGDTTRTATTVTSAALRGAYVLPNLPTPGSYTLTISGAGFLPQTREVNLPAGSGNVVIDATLFRSDAVVTGRVTGLDANGKAEGGLAGVGLTLASNDVTLKTMSTSGATAGSFQFTGVAPGSYVLTAVQFGRTTASATVEVTAAKTQTVNLVLKADIGAELPATAHIRGQVADSRTGGPLTCDRALETVAASDCVATVTVTAPKDPADESKGTVTYTTKATAALNFVYTIPDLDDPDHAGLPPGLYTVTVEAPGYEDTVTHVQVAEGQTMPAPPASMPPLGIISGTVTTRVDKPAKASCVLAVPVGVTVPKTLPTSCTASTDGHTCTATGISGAQPCALTSMGGTDEAPLGTFQVRGLTHGRYQMVLISQDPEYVYTVGAVPIVTLELGADGQFNAVLDRLGRINVNVVKVDPQTGSVNGVSGSTVTATKVSGDGVATAAPVTTDANGIAILKGLNGSYKVQTTFTDSGQSITVDATSDPTGLNQTVPVTLFLAKKSGPLVGRVTTDGGETQPSAVGGVTVTINGTVGYQGATASTGSVQVVTKANGCYAIVPDDWSPVNNGTLESPDCPVNTFAVTDSPAVGGVGAVGTLRNLLTGQPATLINDRIDASVAALPKSPSGTWTEPYPVTGQGITDCTSGCSTDTRAIPTINVKASAMPVGSLQASIVGPLGFASPTDTSGLHVNVLTKPSSAGGVTLTPAASFSGSGLAVVNGVISTSYAAALTFTDTQYGGANGQALPGRYKLQVSMSGFTTQDIDLVCRFQSSCIFAVPGGTSSTALQLKQLPSISVDIGPLNGPDVDWTKASVSQTSGPALGSVTVFNDNDPLSSNLVFGSDTSKVVAAGTSYSFSLSVPGYGTSVVSVDCGADYTTATPSCKETATLAPLPDFPATTIKLDPDQLSGVPTQSPTTATATIDPNPGASILVKVVHEDVDNGLGDGGTVPIDKITWTDSRAGVLAGQVVPGDYTITFHRAGYVDTAAYLACDSTGCTLFSDSAHVNQISEVTMPMLPRPELTVKATLPTAPTGTFSFGTSTFTVYRVVGSTETKVSTASLGLTNGSVTGTTATADVTWLDTAQAFAGIAGQQTYRVVASIDGFQQSDVTIDCTASGSCEGEIALTSNPAADAGDLVVTKLPATSVPVQFIVTGPPGIPTATLTEDGAGNLTWQQGSAQANVITPTPPGTSYQIIATLAGYESAEVTGGVGVAKNVIAFACAVGACDFPQIVMTKAATLALMIEGSDGSTAGAADLVLHRGTADSQLSTASGTASVSGRSTTSVEEVTVSGSPIWLDGSYTLDVKAAGYAFTTTSLSKTSVEPAPGQPFAPYVTCDFSDSNGAHTVDGLYLAPGVTTTCTVTLQRLGTIAGTTAWQIKSLDGTPLNAPAIGSIDLKATLLNSSGGTTGTSFTTTSAPDGSFTMTGAKTTGHEGLAAGDWKIETTDTSGKFDDFSGVVTIAANTYALTTTADDDGTTDGKKWGLTILTLAGSGVPIVLSPKKVHLDVKFMSGTSQTAPPDAKITLTDKDSPVTSWDCKVVSGAVVTADTTNYPAGGGEVCSMSSNTVRFIELPPGNYTAAVDYTNAGYSDASTDFTVDPTGQTRVLEFAPGAQVSLITGALADANGTPITTGLDNARVELWKWTCPAQTSTDCMVQDFDGDDLVDSTLLNGQFSLMDVVNGQYRVVVFAPGYADGTSDLLNVVAGNPWTGITIRLRATTATSLKFKVTLGGSADDSLLTGAQVTLRATVNPRQATNPNLSSTVAAGGVVSIPAAVLSGEYEAVVTPNSQVIPFPLTSTTTVTIADTDDGAALDKSGSPLTLDGIATTLTVTQAAGSCAALPASLPLEITDEAGASPTTWTTILAATDSGGSLTSTVYLPADSYQWRANLTGWSNTAIALSVAAGTITGDSSEISSSTTANFTATLKVDGAAVAGATIVATDQSASPASPVTLTDAGAGTYTGCLPDSAAGWKIALNGAAYVDFDDVTTTVTSGTATPDNAQWDGYTLKPAATLDTGAVGTATADLAISNGTTDVWTASGVSVPSAGWTGSDVIVPAGTYSLTATPDAASTAAGFGSTVVSGVQVDDNHSGPKDVSAKLPYTAPTEASVTVTVSKSDASALASGTVTLTLSPAFGTCDGTTDASGQVTCSGLAAGTSYTVSASWDDGGTPHTGTSASFTPTAAGPNTTSITLN